MTRRIHTIGSAFPVTRKKILLSIICSALFSCGVGYKDYLKWKQLYFSIEMESSVGGISQIFFDTGQGSREHDSSRLKVQPGFQKYLFPIPESIKSIRFDPMNKASIVSIKNAGIENGLGDKLKLFSVQSFKAIQQINKIDVSKGVLEIHPVEKGNDPAVAIDNSSFQRQRSRGIDFLTQYAKIYIGYTLLICAMFIGVGMLRRQTSLALRAKVFRWSDRNSYLLTFGACWILLTHRAFGRLASAHLWAEDGPVFITEAINQGFASLFDQYAGYFHTIPRLIAAFVVNFPVEYWPYAVSLISLTAAAAVFAMFVSDSFQEYVDKKFLRFLLCLVLCLSPGLHEILSNLSNLHWILFLAATLIILQKSPPRLFLETPLLSLIFLSAGECVVLLPVLLLRGWQRCQNNKCRNWYQTEFLLAIILLISALLNISQRANNNPGDLAGFAQMLHAFDYSILGQMFYVTLFGSVIETEIRIHLDTWSYALCALVVIVGGCYSLLSIKKELAVKLCVIWICTVGVTLLTWIVRPESINSFPPRQSIESFYLMRYSFVLFPITLIFWLTVINATLDRIVLIRHGWVLAGLFLLFSILGNPAPYRIGAYGLRLWKDDAAHLINVYQSRCFNEFYVKTYPRYWRLRIAKQNNGC